MEINNIQYKPRVLLRFEVQVAEHCNLNCRNCMHYAPLAEPECLDLEEYERDIKKLSDLFCGEVEWIHLMGGEPLLHPNVIEIMRMTRHYFPYGHIQLVTNGILLQNMNLDFYEECRKSNIEICVTKYPIKLDYPKISKLVKNNNVKFKFYSGEERQPTMWRFPIDTRGDFDPNRNFYRCRGANGCLTLRKGKMYTCAPAAHAHHLKKYYDLDIAYSERNGVDIHKAETAEEIMEFLAKPIPFCRYCDYAKRDDYEDDWAVSKKDRYDWISFTFSDDDIKYLQERPKVYIYGAGNWGRKVLERLSSNHVNVKNILVSAKGDNPDVLDGVKVVPICELKDFDKEAVCIIAIDGKAKIEIQHVLREKGITKIIPVMRL